MTDTTPRKDSTTPRRPDTGRDEAVIVAVRARPLNEREKNLKGCKIVIRMEGKKTILNNPATKDAKPHVYSFDYSYNSFDKKAPDYVTQEQVYNDLGVRILDNAFAGYNACLFAYGQTGSGKTFTMMGVPSSEELKGVIPRLCTDLFNRMDAAKKDDAGNDLEFKVQVCYMEIYNEKVSDLLNPKQENLKVRENPSTGPYVERLTKMLVGSYAQTIALMDEGNKARHVAATQMNDQSSRSHAIFTIVLTQIKNLGEVRAETVSKINLVDLAGSERATKTGATGDRLKEGSNINKSLTVLGQVISALAEPGSTKGKHIPYRDSTLTWVLKENLGGNSKTFMLSAMSPAANNYEETLSTLRYADRAKSIVTKAVVNENATDKMIRQLKEEIMGLKNQLVTAAPGPESLFTPRTTQHAEEEAAKLKEQLKESERIISEMQMSWEEKSKQTDQQFKDMGIAAVKVDVKLPYLVNLNEDPNMQEALVYYLQQGTTSIGSTASEAQEGCIILSGGDTADRHCVIENNDSTVTFRPIPGAPSFINGGEVTTPVILAPSDRLTIGSHWFRFVNPNEVATKQNFLKMPKIDLAFAQNELDSAQDQQTRNERRIWQPTPRLGVNGTTPRPGGERVLTPVDSFGSPFFSEGALSARSGVSSSDDLDQILQSKMRVIEAELRQKIAAEMASGKASPIDEDPDSQKSEEEKKLAEEQKWKEKEEEIRKSIEEKLQKEQEERKAKEEQERKLKEEELRKTIAEQLKKEEEERRAHEQEDRKAKEELQQKEAEEALRKKIEEELRLKLEEDKQRSLQEAQEQLKREASAREEQLKEEITKKRIEEEERMKERELLREQEEAEQTRKREEEMALYKQRIESELKEQMKEARKKDETRAQQKRQEQSDSKQSFYGIQNVVGAIASLASPRGPPPAVTTPFASGELMEVCKFNLVFVGHEEVGKTSLRKCLLKEPGLFEKLALPEVKSTIGIDLSEHQIQVGTTRLELQLVDMAGQECYRTHGFFLPEDRCIFVFVWKMSSDVDPFMTRALLEAVQVKCPGASMVLVGTHKDDLKEGGAVTRSLLLNFSAMVNTFLEAIEPNANSRIRIIGNYAASCKNRTVQREPRKGGATKFKQLLEWLSQEAVQICKEDSMYPQSMVPVASVVLGRQILQLRKEGCWVLTSNEYRRLASNANPAFRTAPDELFRVTGLLHSWRNLIHFSRNTNLQKYIFTNPRWIIDLVCTLFSYVHYRDFGSRIFDESLLLFDVGLLQCQDHWDNILRGILSVSVAVLLYRQLLLKIRKTDKHINVCLELMEKFDLVYGATIPAHGGKIAATTPIANAMPAPKVTSANAESFSHYFVPSLFTGTVPRAIQSCLPGLLSGIQKRYAFNILPTDFFPRCLVRLNRFVGRLFMGDVYHPEENATAQNRFWKDGAWIQDTDTTRGFVRVVGRTLHLYFSSSSEDCASPSSLFAAGFHNIITRLAGESRGVVITQFLPCPTSDCESWFEVGHDLNPGQPPTQPVTCKSCNNTAQTREIMNCQRGNAVGRRNQVLDKLVEVDPLATPRGPRTYSRVGELKAEFYDKELTDHEEVQFLDRLVDALIDV